MSTYKNQSRKLDKFAGKIDIQLEAAIEYAKAHPELNPRNIVDTLQFKSEDLYHSLTYLYDLYLSKMSRGKKNRHYYVNKRQTFYKTIRKAYQIKH